MNCDEVSELLAAYTDGELEGEELRAVRQHLEECDHCRKLLEELRVADALLDRCPSLSASDGFVDRVMESARCGGRLPRTRDARILSLRRLSYAAAAAVLIVIGLWVWDGRLPWRTAPVEALLPNLELLEDPQFLGLESSVTGIAGSLDLDIVLSDDSA